MRQVDRLYRLQQLDDELALAEQSDEEIVVRRQELQQTLKAIRQSCRESEKGLHSDEQNLRQAEWSLQETEGRLKELSDRLYSSAIRSVKEATALEEEIAQLRQQKDKHESDILELLEELDQKRARQSQLAEEEARRTRESEASEQEIAEEEASLRKKTARLRQVRAALVQEIPAATLDLYDRIRQTKGGVAVARVEGKTCQGCRLEVALLKRKAAMGEELVRCETCGRILYMP